MAKKLSITKGRWERYITHSGGLESPVVCVEVSAYTEKTDGVRFGYTLHSVNEPGENLQEHLDNATLIADAGNVYQLTGFTPSELAEMAGLIRN